MKISIFFPLLVVGLMSSCNIQDETDIEDLAEAEAAIDFCVTSYREISSSEIDAQVDRAYMLKIPGQMEIIFTRGEAGMFGKRATNYDSFATCGVTRSKIMELYALTGAEVFIDKGGVKESNVDIDDKEAQYLFFLREGSNFRFVGSKNVKDAMEMLKNETRSESK